MTETLLDQIETHLRAALAFNDNAEVAPVALLWPDREQHFVAAVAMLRSRMPILTLGDLDEAAGIGPAYWLRCAVAGTVDVELAEGTPVIYLPGVAREDLRAIEECPRELAPIAELQYRGQWFAHPNGKDWTVRAFLTNNERGLGLDVADGAATNDALLGAFDELLALPMRRLSQHIDAEFLQRLLNPDLAARLLEWLDDPNGFRTRVDDAQWMAFVGLCKTEYDFDPGSQGEVTGGRLLGERQGGWAEVWRRFEQDPDRYAGVEERLRKGRPTGQMSMLHGLATSPAWPQDNQDAESALSAALAHLATSPVDTARGEIQTLWEEHHDRRNWVWAKLDQTPLVFALEHLQRLAQLTNSGPNGDVNQLTTAYADGGWQADEAFLGALVAAPDAATRQIVADAGLAVYRPWLDTHARALQQAIGPQANAGTYVAGPEASTESGTATVFIDGLRLDLAHRLVDRLGGFDTSITTELAALPTVTDTAKPVLTPVPEGTLTAGKDLGPARASSGAKANIAVLRNAMIERGGWILDGVDAGSASGWAWAEAGTIDSRGHQFQAAFVDDIDRDLDDIAKRVKILLDAGWKRVEIVTDHGWLLVPGGMERVDLPAAAVEIKKGRCARLKEGADVWVPTVPWHWDGDVRIGLAPGITCFEANQEYQHGGVSLQECVVPRILVRAGAAPTTTGGAVITTVKWLGLMCRVQFENVGPGATVDLRALPADATTSVAAAVKETTKAGKQSLHVKDEDLEGEPAFVVVVGHDGSILAQRDVTIGANR